MQLFFDENVKYYVEFKNATLNEDSILRLMNVFINCFFS